MTPSSMSPVKRLLSTHGLYISKLVVAFVGRNSAFSLAQVNMKADALTLEIRKAALNYAHNRKLTVDESHASAVIFRNLSDNFHSESFKNIANNREWQHRTAKTHQNVAGMLEMQSSNSSDALLMNIFCHPDIGRWKGIRNLINETLDAIVFGFPGQVHMKGEQVDSTEIDMALTGLFCEAKLTENDFTQKTVDVVERYDGLHATFHAEDLPRVGGKYDNYQIIRNLLAAFQHGKKHILLCDERRSDLVLRYMQTVSCLREMQNRKNCRVVFWQEIAGACGASLRDWIEEKYGIY